jgi:glycosyltransferase involved in cell wall biosynthesis
VSALSEPRPNASTLSIILPAYNEEDSVELLHEAIIAAVEPMRRSFEIVFIDDGSSDNTFVRCEALAQADPRVRVIKFRRNHGQTAAMIAGIDHASGEILITMDADLQNDPADIPLLVQKIEQGYEVVVGWRHHRQDKLLSRRLPSVAAGRLIAIVTRVDIKDNGCSLKAYRADLIKRVPLHVGMHRFIPAMISMAGARIAQVKVCHHSRRFGTSKYGLSRFWKVLLDLLTVKTLLLFAERPLLCFSRVALLAGLISALSLSGAVSYTFYATDPSIVLIAVSILFASLALFLVLLGTIAHMIYQGAIEIAVNLIELPPAEPGTSFAAEARRMVEEDAGL